VSPKGTTPFRATPYVVAGSDSQGPPATPEPVHILDSMARLKAAETPFALATVVRTEGATSAKVGAKALVCQDAAMVGWIGGGCIEGAVRKAAAQALNDGRARMIRVRPAGNTEDTEDVEAFKNSCASGGTAEIFIEPMLPRPLLLIAGGSPTGRALADLGRRVGFAVTVAALSDDLAGFTEAERRIEGFAFSDEARVDSSFIVVATQGKRDREALESALATGAPFVAFIGSRRKSESLKEQLLARGVDPARVAALRAPAGLDIGSQSPEEIALSVLAEIVQARRQGPSSSEELQQAAEGVQVEIVASSPGGCCGEEPEG
jgi:xanthine dehydrogenase accessory factor